MRSVFLVIVILVNANLLAQTVKEDRILLNNGSLFKGKIIDSTDLAIRIECYDLNIYAINKKDIKERTQGLADLNYKLNFDSVLVAEKATAYFTKGFKKNVALHYAINISGKSNSINSKMLAFDLGYRFNRSILIGVHTGVQLIENNNRSWFRPVIDGINVDNLYNLYDNAAGYKGRISVPFCLNIEQTLFLGKISSVFNFNIGYDINLTKVKTVKTDWFVNFESAYHKENVQWKNGFIINPELKFVKMLNSKLAFLTSFGFIRNKAPVKHLAITNRYNAYAFSPLLFSGVTTNNLIYNFIYIKAGIAF
jgi:hypothetical protein